MQLRSSSIRQHSRGTYAK